MSVKTALCVTTSVVVCVSMMMEATSVCVNQATSAAMQQTNAYVRYMYMYVHVRILVLTCTQMCPALVQYTCVCTHVCVCMLLCVVVIKHSTCQRYNKDIDECADLSIPIPTCTCVQLCVLHILYVCTKMYVCELYKDLTTCHLSMQWMRIRPALLVTMDTVTVTQTMSVAVIMGSRKLMDHVKVRT